jgi:hypothetical protein
MAGRLTPLGFFLKWIVVPVSLGAIGYFLVGPRVEIPKELESKVREVTGQGGKPPTLQATNEDEPESNKPEKTFAAPEVDVTVTALNKPTKPKRKKRRRRPTVTTPSQSEPSAPEPPANGGGGEPPPTGDGV